MEEQGNISERMNAMAAQLQVYERLMERIRVQVGLLTCQREELEVVIERERAMSQGRIKELEEELLRRADEAPPGSSLED